MRSVCGTRPGAGTTRSCTGVRACASPRPRASVAYERVARHFMRDPAPQAARVRGRMPGIADRAVRLAVDRGQELRLCGRRDRGDIRTRASRGFHAARGATGRRTAVDAHAAEAPRAVEFTVTDNVGVRDVRLLVDGRPAAQSVSPCDPTLPVPCPARRRARLVLEARADPRGDPPARAPRHRRCGELVTARRTTVVAADRDEQGGGNGVGWIAALALLGGLAAADAARTAAPGAGVAPDAPCRPWSRRERASPR